MPRQLSDRDGLGRVEGLCAFVKTQLQMVRRALTELSGEELDDEKLAAGIRQANVVRRYLRELRELVFTAQRCPMGALEMLVAEMFAIHFCSDKDETIEILRDMIEEVKSRTEMNKGVGDSDAVRIFWVNPVAGASHCTLEGRIIADYVWETLGMSVLEIEVSPVSDSMGASLGTRMEALVETVQQRRKT